ncbi:MAG: L-proline glycine betaine ABC transport system permease protein ProV [Candidatus Jettenia ecosi]|uniref:L-proline glycine betaine ABC transport system permease protein ProV n=1 Tax=Candidatus Jettenia ecosi TaxID=2494326 RepID=A0A533QEX6_9BACT|nr:MAG: L-proline glycine betaine ABC transport system permease protein ProV [Candidatus Jettenia ecosi]
MQILNSVFEVKGISKIYDSTQALSCVDLSVPSEQTTVVIGPSGCGKSTLLRLMIGLARPDTGKIYFEGTEITPMNALLLRRRMGYVTQTGGLFPHLTARKNVILMANYLGWEKTLIEKRLLTLAELTQFPKDGLQRFPAQLSGGQQQRVALMRALMLNPDALLLDEPMGALDPITRYDLQNDLKGIFHKLRKSVVLVTHNIEEAKFFGNQMVLMQAGRIIQQGTIHEFIETPADPFVTRFIKTHRGPLEIQKGGDA